MLVQSIFTHVNNGITVGMWGKTHCFDVQCKLSRNSMHLSHSVNLVDSQLQPELGYMHPPFLKYDTKVKLSMGAWSRPPDPCIHCKREDVTKRYRHLSQRRDQPLFYIFVKNAYAFKDDDCICRMCEARFRKSLEMSQDTEATSSKWKLRKYDTAIDTSCAFETNDLNLTILYQKYCHMLKKNPYLISQNHIFSKDDCEVISG